MSDREDLKEFLSQIKFARSQLTEILVQLIEARALSHVTMDWIENIMITTGRPKEEVESEMEAALDENRKVFFAISSRGSWAVR